ncbi:family 16 glycosylhydrolase [Amycolatopsis palatopharyngis]|uniref:family 16 glycosylhydrolase n=1 Tax=Amycolatopsis palatopharyngis TaxID=187982 RepID=UPI000E27E230|nr:family 16 glycosylhydrolase [Amycolatopsis palatopharyngis]
MNTLTFAEFKERLAHRVRLRTRVLDPQRRASVFSQSGEANSLGRIYVINLDRKPDRWRRVGRELDRFRGRHGERLTALTRRISAIDARYLTSTPDPAVLRPAYTLADQLTVDPNPLLKIDDSTRAHEIAMTRQEIAVALSHIETWRRVVAGDDAAALLLEDDVVIAFGFARRLKATWTALQDPSGSHDFDLLYLAYKDVSTKKPSPGAEPVHRREPGVWEAAAYVLTKAGAQKLLDQLPAFGPIDLWLNLQFATLKTFTAGRHLIEQRIDEPSTNSYSVLPVLSQVGVITKEKALLPSSRRLRGPVFGLGDAQSGLTSLARALSMVGYTCSSDLDQMPAREFDTLRRGERGRLFNAYVNIGSLDGESVREIVAANPHALFVLTTPDHAPGELPAGRVLHLAPTVADKWNSLSEFLDIEYPAFPYPEEDDVGQRSVASRLPLDTPLPATDLTFDTSPWILSRRLLNWQGIPIQPDQSTSSATTSIEWFAGEPLDDETWKFRDDTFPSNLALFSPKNVTAHMDGLALAVRRERTPVREFTAAAIASRMNYLYGSFEAELRPSNVPGLITGLFLHRNGPRQEIDIEFLGRDTTKMLVNVFYNPGPDGTKLEYGYRGTPTEIRLDFDAAAAFHIYEIDWRPNHIAWKVDGVTVDERTLWNPTPIPDRPLEFNLNLWHSRSSEFAGCLDTNRLPTCAEVRSIVVTTSESHVVPGTLV